MNQDEGQSTDSAPPQKMGMQIQEAIQRYQTSIPLKLKRIQTSLGEGKGFLTEEELMILKEKLHELAISASSFGYLKAGNVCREFEGEIQSFLNSEDFSSEKINWSEKVGKLFTLLKLEFMSAPIPSKNSPLKVFIKPSTTGPIDPKRQDQFQVLLLEADPDLSALVALLLEEVGVETEVVLDPDAALKRIVDDPPDLLLIDLQLPGFNGINLLRVLRSDLQHKNLPIIVMTSAAEHARIEEAYQYGANDYVEKPLIKNLFQLRILNFLQKQSEYLFMRDRDALTGLYNRRAFTEQFQRSISKEDKKCHAFAIIDLDHFKPINDQYGHQVGDEVLAGFSSLLIERSEGVAQVARWGGEEFVCLFDSMNGEQAKAFVENLLLEWKGKGGSGVYPPTEMSFSCGISLYPEAGNRLEEIFKVADEALYQAKALGRGRVLVQSEIASTASV